MITSRLSCVGGSGRTELLWEDDERVFYKRIHNGSGRDPITDLVVLPAAPRPTANSINRFTHEDELKADLAESWAVRPLELMCEHGQLALILKDTGGEPLQRFIATPMQVGKFLQLAVAITAALGKLHARSLIH